MSQPKPTRHRPNGRRLAAALPPPVLLPLLLSALLCTACGSLLPLSSPEVTLYNLTSPAAFGADLPQVDWQLVVEEPLTRGGLDNNRIAVRPSTTELQYFAGARWTERSPRMVQSLLVESFEDTGKIVAVGQHTIGLRSDYNLKSELREFQAEYFEDGKAPKVRVRLHLKLVRQPRQEIIAATTFHQVQVAEGRKMPQVIAAFDTALAEVLRDAVAWALTTPPPSTDPAAPAEP